MLPFPTLPIGEANVELIERFEDNPYNPEYFMKRVRQDAWIGQFIYIGHGFKEQEPMALMLYKNFVQGVREIRVLTVAADDRRRRFGSKIISCLKLNSMALATVVDEDNLEGQLFLRAMGFKGEYLNTKRRFSRFVFFNRDGKLLFKWYSKRAVPAEGELSLHEQSGDEVAMG